MLANASARFSILVAFAYLIVVCRFAWRMISCTTLGLTPASSRNVAVQQRNE
ncbi:MAG: hypothetical protein NTW87_03325 [Planctomycetota bacterium]|nr:hypothetical protein [Planctomycetota bacterium]